MVTALVVVEAALAAGAASAQESATQPLALQSAAAAHCRDGRLAECQQLYEKALAIVGIRPGQLRWDSSEFAWLSSRELSDPISTAEVVTGWASARLQLYLANSAGEGLLDAIGGARAVRNLLTVRRRSVSPDAATARHLDAEIRRAADVELEALSLLRSEPKIADAAYELVTTTRTRSFMDFLWAQFEMHRSNLAFDQFGRLKRAEREIDPNKHQLIRLSFLSSLLAQTVDLERREPRPRNHAIDQLNRELRTVYARLLNESGESGLSPQAVGRNVLRQLDGHRHMMREYGKRRDPQSVPTVADVLRSNDGVLQYHVTDRYVFAFLVHAPETLLEHKPVQTEMFFIGETRPLERLVSRLVLQLSDPQQHGWDFTATELYGRLLSRVLSAERNIRFLYIVPSRFLFRLPFGVLRDPHDGRTLSEKVPHAYLPHADALPLLGFERLDVEARGLVVGVRHFSSHHELKLAEEESTHISKTLPVPTHLRLGSKGQAVADAVLQDMGRYGIIHIGSHATRDPQPWLSGLVLKTGEGQDTVLPAYKFLMLPRPLQPGLIVLSACETGVVQVDENDDAQGLPTALLAAGAGALVVSLWKVPEEATALLMRQFYDLLAEKGQMSVSVALATAQQRLNASQDYKHPFYWGAFIAIGYGKTRW